MSRRKHSNQPGQKSLQHTTEVVVRFQEVDSLKIVWHGHYVSYFEDARVAFGQHYGLGYSDFLNAGLIVPIVQMSIDYLAPAKHGDQLEVTARLFWSEAAKIEFGYNILRSRDQLLLASGQTTQVFTDANGEMLLARPDFMSDFYARWAAQAEAE